MKKKIEINGIAYDFEGIVDHAELATARELLDSAGFGLKTLAQRLNDMPSNTLDVLEDRKTLDAYIAFLWLARRNAGETISFEEASRVRLSSLKWIIEDEPKPEEPVESPKGLTDSAPAESPATQA